MEVSSSFSAVGAVVGVSLVFTQADFTVDLPTVNHFVGSVSHMKTELTRHLSLSGGVSTNLHIYRQVRGALEAHKVVYMDQFFCS